MAIIFTPPQGVIALSESSFSPTGEEDGDNPSNNTFDITNDGGVTLDWTATKNAAWLSLDTTSGTTDSSPDSDTITVSYDTTGLQWENSPFTDTITITDAAAFNSPQTISVSLTVTEVVVPPVPDHMTFLIHSSGVSNGYGVILEVAESERAFADNGLWNTYRGTMQSDGRVVLPGDTSLSSTPGPVVVKCYEAGQLITESWSTSIGGSLGWKPRSYPDIAILNSGNIVVSWTQSSTAVPYFAILSPEGAVLQGMTNARAHTTSWYIADPAIPVFITPLEDGGFLLTWKFYSYAETAASVWNANGSNRVVGSDFFGGSDESYYAEPGQMPTDASPSYYSGQFMVADAYNGYGYWYNVTDLGEEWDYEGSDYYGDYYICSVLPMWATDAKMAIINSRSGTIRGTVITDADVYEVDDVVMLSSDYTLNSVTALYNNTFLVQATSGSDEGINYWIFDASLSLVSGPTAAFATADFNNRTNIKGGGI